MREMFNENCIARKKNWIGHLLRGDGLSKDVLEGRKLRKKRRGRPRAKIIDDLMAKPKSREGRENETVTKETLISSEEKD